MQAGEKDTGKRRGRRGRRKERAKRRKETERERVSEQRGKPIEQVDAVRTAEQSNSHRQEKERRKSKEKIYLHGDKCLWTRGD